MSIVRFALLVFFTPGYYDSSERKGVDIMVDMANAWPNYYAGVLWLIAFIGFVLVKYPHSNRGEHK